MYTRPCFLFPFFSLLFCLLHVIPHWSGVIIILENKDGMYLVAARRFHCLCYFSICSFVVHALLWLLCLAVRYDHSPKKSSSWLAFTCVFRYFGAWVSFLVFGEKSGLIYRCLAFCKKFFLFLVGIVSLLFCPLQIFDIIETMGVPR